MNDDWSTLHYAVVDVEGNGQQLPDLVELGVVHIADGQIGEPQSWLVKPAWRISPFATRIHGISNDDVADSPGFADVADEVRQALDVDAVVAHNAQVDVGVLRRHLGQWDTPEVFDTLNLARRFLPGYSSYRLGALVEALDLATGLSDGLKPHRASYDVLVTARLFLSLASSGEERMRSLEELRGQFRVDMC